jgi:RHS repeat-associated protein
MAQQKASGNYSNPYLLHGKDLDEETGLYYYGARYYNPMYSVWLGVDPMVEKYASLSPLAYCLNNPVILLDPDGKEIFISSASGEKVRYEKGMEYDGGDKYIKTTIRTLNKIQRRGRDEMGIINFFEKNNEVDFTIIESNEIGGSIADVKGISKNYNFLWNQKVGGKNKGGDKKYFLSPALILLHEIGEAFYAYTDPEGKLNELRAWQNLDASFFDSQDDFERAQSILLNNYLDKEKQEVGDYHTYSDKWIIKFIEPAFQKKSRGQSRDTHVGTYMTVKGGTFSVREQKNDNID